MNIHNDQSVRTAYEKCLHAYQEESRLDLLASVRIQDQMTPIEQIAFFKLMELARCSVINQVVPQFSIKNYRVDFLVILPRDEEKYVIECDGHDFHEKTKEQAAKDKKRDRDLQLMGFKVLHFTGSEIWKSSGNCILESMGVLYRKKQDGI